MMGSTISSVEHEREVVAALAARVLGAAPLTVERVPEGVSTRVYRVRRGAGTFYIRVLPEPDASFAPEAVLHGLLRARGVRVPEVLLVEDCNERLQRSVMVTTEIPGSSVGERPVDSATRGILREAGRQLALINTIEVAGFGWIRRDAAARVRLVAEHPTHRAFATESVEVDLAALGARLLPSEQIAAIRAMLDRHQTWLDAAEGRLAHGDFDLTPIFQKDGMYTGIIDFGEARGADRWYDLGHFRMHDGETAPLLLLDHLVAGYRDVTPLPGDAHARICFASLLIAIRALARQLEKRYHVVHRHHALVSIPRDLAVLASL